MSFVWSNKDFSSFIRGTDLKKSGTGGYRGVLFLKSFLENLISAHIVQGVQNELFICLKEIGPSLKACTQNKISHCGQK
jgi:hypothetical protein